MAVYGVDISAHQPGFDFAANRQACPFVVLKQTEGLSWPEHDDPDATALLRAFRDEAQAAGYALVGLYHFARPQPGRTGREEAQHFVDFVGDLHANEGVVLDYEMNTGLGFEALEDFAIDFVDAIESRFPAMVGRVLLYSYPSFLANMSTDRLVQRCPLWIAAYGRDDGAEHPEAVALDRWDAYALWQFTSKGHMPGYGGEVDVNRFDGDEAILVASGPGRVASGFPPFGAPGAIIRSGPVSTSTAARSARMSASSRNASPIAAGRWRQRGSSGGRPTPWCAPSSARRACPSTGW